MRAEIRLLAVLLLLAMPLASLAEVPPWSGKSVLQDPEWRKRFLGSYGFLSGAEPDIKPTELEMLREVIELMKTNTTAAAAVLRAQVNQDSSAALDFILANLEFQTGQNESAARYYRSAIGKFPDFRRAHKNLGLLLVQEGRYDEAVQHLSRAVELGDRDGRNYGLLGFSYLNLEDPLAAESAYRSAVMQQPGTRDWKLGLGRALLAMEKHREAVALFGSLIEADPDDSSAWLLQANSYVALEEPLAAAVNLEAVRMLGKAETSSLVLLGDIYMNAGMPDLAKSAYLEVIRGDAKSAQFDTAYRAAELLIRARAFGEAEEILASVDERYGEKLSTDQELAILTLKAKAARAQGRKREAARQLESIVARDGTRGEALIELARYHHEQGDSERALMLIERASKLDAYQYQALLEHAQFRVAKRDYAEAARLLRRALALRSEPRVERFLARVEQALR